MFICENEASDFNGVIKKHKNECILNTLKTNTDVIRKYKKMIVKSVMLSDLTGLQGIVETMYQRQISIYDIEHLHNELLKGVKAQTDRFMLQYHKFGHLGFTPRISNII